MNMHTWRLSDKSPKIDDSRIDHEKELAVPTSIIFSGDLSILAKGVLACIYGSQKREVTIQDIKNTTHKDSVRSIRNAMRELEEKGYIVRVRAGE